MKVIAIGSFATPPTPEQRAEILPKEVPATLRLYLDGVIEQFWFRTDKPGVVFLLNVESVDAARETLGELPLDKAGLMQFDLQPVGPLAPLGLLLQNRQPKNPLPLAGRGPERAVAQPRQVPPL